MFNDFYEFTKFARCYGNIKLTELLKAVKGSYTNRFHPIRACPLNV